MAVATSDLTYYYYYYYYYYYKSYQATGRGFVIQHDGHKSIFQSFYYSHFQPGFEFLILLLIPIIFRTTVASFFLGLVMVWVLVVSYLWTPFLYNPNGLDYSAVTHSINVGITFIIRVVMMMMMMMRHAAALRLGISS